jgi:hypothetical protein
METELKAGLAEPSPSNVARYWKYLLLLKEESRSPPLGSRKYVFTVPSGPTKSPLRGKSVPALH